MTLSLIQDPRPDFVTVPLLPRLEIVAVQKTTGNCYMEVVYRVRSLSKLSEEDFDWLLAKGYFMDGQIFSVSHASEGDKSHAGRWTVDGRSWVSFYEYSVTCACDSGD